jgi:hypothetical protein
MRLQAVHARLLQADIVVRAQVVEPYDAIASTQERLRQRVTDESGSAGD